MDSLSAIRTARGLVAYRTADTWLAMAVRAVAAGGLFVDPDLAEAIVDYAWLDQAADTPAQLTRQQRRVLECLPATDREIAERLGVSPDTVKAHMKEARITLGASNRHEALDPFRQRRQEGW